MSQDATFRPPEDNTVINVKVVFTTTGYDEVSKFFRMRWTTRLYKVRSVFAYKVGKDVNNVRLLYDENRINDDDTPASLEMEDNDTIMAELTWTNEDIKRRSEQRPCEVPLDESGHWKGGVNRYECDGRKLEAVERDAKTGAPCR
ncbi:hypothetical protein BJV77DRAFT_959278 [Russula vinacea]|nr:hypothetical protein BJV77DRAFT_959278 [Russula vinacea]